MQEFKRIPHTVLVLIATAFLVTVSIFYIASSHAQPGSTYGTDKASGVAVVELFTSQGCSSCPPADQLLAAVAELNTKRRLPVYCLSFHVDYWNSLGWADPFSDKQYTARQHAYAAKMRSDRVYTPQMVVNGAVEFVGSDAGRAKEAFKAALSRQPSSKVALQTQSLSDGSQIAVRYAVSRSQPREVLNVALAQIAAGNAVPRGENAGKDLSHVNVVRAFQTVELDKQGGD